MPRWIAFDQQTSSLLRMRLARDNRIETFGRGALDYALAKPGAVVTLLPSVEGEIGLAVFRPPRLTRFQSNPARATVAPSPAAARVIVAAAPPVTRANAPSPSAVTRAGGFLGLSDEPVFEEEQPVKQKKGWWHKFWDD